MLEVKESGWFVHLRYDPPLPLKITREDGRSARVVGGKSGSHRTGHGETYWDKIVEIIGQGYVPVPVAKDLRMIDTAWQPPSESTLDERIRAGEYRFRG